eukprot:598456-Amphidinium_carterae.1
MSEWMNESIGECIAQPQSDGVQAHLLNESNKSMLFEIAGSRGLQIRPARNTFYIAGKKSASFLGNVEC